MATVKVKLGSRPKSFKKTVTFPMLDGATGSIGVDYKYRTRKEFAEFIDEIMAGTGKTKRPGDEDFSMSEVMSGTAEANANYVLKVVDAWNLEEDLTAENVKQLYDEIPAAVLAIMETYRLAITEGRTAN